MHGLICRRLVAHAFLASELTFNDVRTIPGIALRDWRYAVRICNIDVSDLLADTTGASVKIIEAMIRAVHRIPNLKMGRSAFYMNRTILECLDIQAMNKSNVQLKIQEYDGEFITSLRGVPFRTVDALLSAAGKFVVKDATGQMVGTFSGTKAEAEAEAERLNQGGDIAPAKDARDDDLPNA